VRRKVAPDLARGVSDLARVDARTTTKREAMK
jgi:hypothetical protein